MTSEIKLAFSHPEERARATEEGGLPDRISLRDHVVAAEIGAFQQERGREQRLCFNVVVELRPMTGIDDDVDRVVSYDRITEAITAELAGDRLNLLETLAERVAERVLAAPRALRVFVRIEKLDLGPGALGVEIVRSQSGNAGRSEIDIDAVHPLVIFLSNEAIASPNLSAWLDQIEATGQPAIICVGLPDAPAPATDRPAAQRRIDLLAIEQNAWVLAARDNRCVVRETRTELDWAAKHNLISVWAPSKMVLDAAEPPVGMGASDLFLWLGRHLDASRMISVGAPAGPAAQAIDADAPTLL